EAERAHRFRVGVRLPFHKVSFDVSAEFVAKHVGALLPKGLSTRRTHEIHDDKLPTAPQRLRPQSLPPLPKSLLRVRKECHKGWDKPNSLLFRKRCVVAQSLRNDLG